MYRGGGHGGGRGGDYGGRGKRGGGGSVDGSPDASSDRDRGSSVPSSYAASESEVSSLAEEIQTSLFLTVQQAEVSVGSGSRSDVAAAEWAGSPAEVKASHSLLPASSEALVHAPQPGWGKVGRKMCHFLVEVAQNSLCLYDVDMTPETKSSGTNRAVMGELIEAHKHSFFGGKIPAYDGRKSIYTAGPLPFESKTFVVKLSDVREKYEEEGKMKKGKKRDDEEFKVSIRYVGRVDLAFLQQFLFGKMSDMSQEAIQVFDVVLREFTNPSPVAFLLPPSNVLTVNTMKNLCDWANIPIIEEISKSIISIGDYIRFRAVCWPWRLNSIPPVEFPSQLPWLMMPYDSNLKGDNGIRLFYDIWQSKMHKIPLPETINQVCCASYSGWLFLLSSRWASSQVRDVFLLNALTRRRVMLPPLSNRVKLRLRVVLMTCYNS